MKYPDEINRKGLLKCGDDKTVEYAKPAYYALQNLAAIFDNTLQRIADYPCESNSTESLSVFGYANRDSGLQVITIWLDGETPSDSNATRPVDLTFSSGAFEEPVYVDLREGKVYEIPPQARSKQGGVYTFRDVPCYDSPILIADKSLIPLKR